MHVPRGWLSQVPLRRCSPGSISTGSRRVDGGVFSGMANADAGSQSGRCLRRSTWHEGQLGVIQIGTAMSAAMASGDVQLSVSQGLPPFVVAVSGGQDLQVVDIAVSYSENDNCVVSSALEIDKDSASELNGKKVAVPLGTAAHYSFLKQMDSLRNRCRDFASSGYGAPGRCDRVSRELWTLRAVMVEVSRA